MSVQNAESENQFCRLVWYRETSVVCWPTPTVSAAPRVGWVPSPSYRPRRSSRMFARAFPVPRRTAVESSFTTQVSPLVTSYPAAAMRSRAVTPAVYQLDPVLATQFDQAVNWISASAWKFEPSARIRHAASGRSCVLLPTIGGTEM